VTEKSRLEFALRFVNLHDRGTRPNQRGSERGGIEPVSARYVCYYKGAPNHCGYESYGLFHDRGIWKIISFADTDNVLKGRSVNEVCPED
jgi:hypothetical protein